MAIRMLACRAKKTDVHSRLSKSEEHAGAAPEQLAGQLTQETKDDGDIKNAGCRLRRANSGRLPGHPGKDERSGEPQDPSQRQPKYGYIVQVSQRMLRGPGPYTRGRDRHPQYD